MWTEVINVDNINYFKGMINIPNAVKLKLNEFKDIAKVLADEVDHANRTALSIASDDVKNVFYKCLFFLERYEFHTGPPVYKSSTSLIILATDHLVVDKVFIPKFLIFQNDNHMTEESFVECFTSWKFSEEGFILKTIGNNKQDDFKFDFNDCDYDGCGKISQKEFINYCLKIIEPRVVILKFIKNEIQYQKEVEARSNKELDANFVVNTIDTFDISFEIKEFKHKHLEGEYYKFMITMPAADRNLKDIIEKEKPCDDVKRILLKGVAEAIQHLHENHLVHGDIKALNIVRKGENSVRLIDLDASTKIGYYAGEKFSTGVIPPEMFATLDDNEKNRFLEYCNGIKEVEFKSKLKPVRDRSRNCHYVVRAYIADRIHDNFIPRKDFLIEASTAIDIWSFGVLMFNMLSTKNQTLFKVDINDDLPSTYLDYKEIINMKDSRMISIIRDNITNNSYATDLLINILKVEPSERLSFEAILVCNCSLFYYHTQFMKDCYTL